MLTVVSNVYTGVTRTEISGCSRHPTAPATQDFVTNTSNILMRTRQMLQSNRALFRMTQDTGHGSRVTGHGSRVTGHGSRERFHTNTGSDQTRVDAAARDDSALLHRYNNASAHRQKSLCAADLSINGLGYYGFVSQVLNSLIAYAKTL
jgi:hypothetical protein